MRPADVLVPGHLHEDRAANRCRPGAPSYPGAGAGVVETVGERCESESAGIGDCRQCQEHGCAAANRHDQKSDRRLA